MRVMHLLSISMSSYMFLFCCVCFLGVIHHFCPSHFSSTWIFERWGQDYIKNISFRAECSKMSHSPDIVQLCHCVNCHLLQEETSLRSWMKPWPDPSLELGQYEKLIIMIIPFKISYIHDTGFLLILLIHYTWYCSHQGIFMHICTLRTFPVIHYTLPHPVICFLSPRHFHCYFHVIYTCIILCIYMKFMNQKWRKIWYLIHLVWLLPVASIYQQMI